KAKILAQLDALLERASERGASDFARAIMTTDTFPKATTATFAAAAGKARATGFAKGAGMIHPDMATMLAFVLADAAPFRLQDNPRDLQALLRAAADRSSHRVAVDGDTSPNDTLLLWAGGGACEREPFERAVTEAGQQLARAIARDGEGATRLMTVQVRSAHSEAEATLVGRTIPTRPPVKTAVARPAPHWG